MQYIEPNIIIVHEPDLTALASLQSISNVRNSDNAALQMNCNVSALSNCSGKLVEEFSRDVRWNHEVLQMWSCFVNGSNGYCCEQCSEPNCTLSGSFWMKNTTHLPNYNFLNYIFIYC